MPTDLRTLARVLRDDIAPHSATQSTMVVERPHASLRRYGTPEQLAAAREAGAVPVLLVPPLAVDARCYDLAPGVSPANSVVEFLLSTGTVPYVVDFGPVGRAERGLGFEDYFGSFIPRAIADVVSDYDAAATLDLMGWSLGGTLSFLTAGNDPSLPIRSVIAVTTPLNYQAIPPYPLVRKLLGPTGGRPATCAMAALGGIPAPLVRAAYRASAWQRELKKPKYIVENLHDEDALARMQVIDRFQRSMPGYPGRVSQQMLTNLILRDEIAGGVLDFDGLVVDLHSIAVPIALFGSHWDAICSFEGARHGVDLFTGSPHVEFHTVESSHLGALTGPDAESVTWPAIAGFRAELDRAEHDRGENYN
ncbi:MAG: alpha/beta hydrolase [Gordonia sp. (in: high G+C Gram-positive bacteria)]